MLREISPAVATLIANVELSSSRAYGMRAEYAEADEGQPYVWFSEESGCGQYGVMLCQAPSGGWALVAADCVTILGNGTTPMAAVLDATPSDVALCLFHACPPPDAWPDLTAPVSRLFAT